MEITQAAMGDLPGVLALHKKYHVDSISAEDKAQGFVTTNFTDAQLHNLIARENGITIAKRDGVVVAYAMAASWGFWADWPFFTHMIEKLPENSFEGRPLSAGTSYQYGPICVDGSVRGSGVFEQVFYASLAHMAKRYPIMVTFVNQINGRSVVAHTKKVPMTTVGTFSYNSNDYYMLACHTK